MASCRADPADAGRTPLAGGVPVRRLSRLHRRCDRDLHAAVEAMHGDRETDTLKQPSLRTKRGFL